MRHRDAHDPSSISLSRPSLPRLRNRASLGRLNAYGGVLDFEVTSSKGKSYDFNMTSRSDSSKSTFSLAGPAATTTTFSSDYNTIMHQSTSSKQEHQEESNSNSNMHTPEKNTTQATLRALKMLDREEINNKNSKHAITPSSSASNVIPFIPVLDSDHPQAQSQTGHGQGHGRGEHQTHSHSRQVSTTPSRPTLDLDVDVDAVVEGSGSCASTSRSAALGKTTGRARRGAGAEKDEERLVREIREDMDEGGYASLEQILARNGFQVCRIATPPSTERHSHIHTTSISTSILSSISPSPSMSHYSSKPITTEGSGVFHPLSKVISGSSSSNIATTTNTQSQRETKQNTIKNKSSMLSFSGFVSTLWGNPNISATLPSAHATNIASQSTMATSTPKVSSRTMGPTASNANTKHDDSASSRSAQKAHDGTLEGEDDDLGNTGGKRIESNNKNEDIKGWLRQTVEATNTYMNEAKNAIEAAKAAMGSSSSSSSSTAMVNNNENTTRINKKGGASSSSSFSTAGDRDGILGDDDEQDGDTTFGYHERRQATQSTLESKILETPTSSPTAQTHGTPKVDTIEVYDKKVQQQHVLLKSPPYSPPLKQIHQIEPQITVMEASYFDSPLVKKQMKRSSVQDRLVGGTKDTQFPHTSGNSSASRIGIKEAVEESLQENHGKASAEDMLRGTLRHALSTSTLRGEGAIAIDTSTALPAPPAVASPKTGYRPSIATIFGIPISFTSSTPTTTSSSATNTKSRKVKQCERNNLKESTTESLSTETTSTKTHSSTTTSAKDTTSISSSSAAISSIAPKILRKTASKHTLRKAASPILSNAIIVHRDEEENDLGRGGTSSTPAPTPTPGNGKGKSSVGDINTSTDAESTPVRSRPAATTGIAALPRGPVPLKYTNTNKVPTPTAIDRKAGGSSNNSHSHSNNNGTPRQVAHRNPRDSPVGETRVLKKSPTSPLNVKRYPSGPPLALSSSSSSASSSSVSSNISSNMVNRKQKEKIQHAQENDTPVKKGVEGNNKKKMVPSIMDDENEVGGLWSPPRPSPMRNSKRAPLGETRNTQPTASSSPSKPPASTRGNGAAAVDMKGSKIEIKPRLKAKESLERILAYKQMQEEALLNHGDNKSKGDEIPPVPALPPMATVQPASESMKKNSRLNQDVPLTHAAMIADTTTTTQSEDDRPVATSSVGAKERKVQTLRSRSSFTGTLRGILGSAVSGWTDSLPSSSSSSASHSSSSSSSSNRRVTILPSNYTSSTSKTSATSRPNRNKSIRRAKSMYITQMEAARIQREEEAHQQGRSTSSNWIAMERDNRNNSSSSSMILPTIVISDYTHD